MRIKAITIILVILVATIKLVNASPDTYYLEDNNTLTTTQPVDPYTTVTISGGGGSYTNTWFSTTMGGGTISSGTYTFTFWMYASNPQTDVTVTFTFGYYNGGYNQIATATGSFIVNTSYSEMTLSVNVGNPINIPKDSQLYLTVNIQNNEKGQKTAYFIYSGTTYKTNINTPPISVPEFPMGVFLLPHILLALYLILKRLPKLS